MNAVVRPIRLRERVYIIITFPAWCWAFFWMVVICPARGHELKRALDALARGDFADGPNNAVRGAAEPRTLNGLVGSSEVPK
jgi:hypothetical protein